MMGVPYEESFIVAELIGTKLFLNEFVAYKKLSELKQNRLNGFPEFIDDKRQWISVSKCFEFGVYFKIWQHEFVTIHCTENRLLSLFFIPNVLFSCFRSDQKLLPLMLFVGLQISVHWAL